MVVLWGPPTRTRRNEELDERRLGSPAMRALIAAPLGEVNVVEVVDSAFVTFDTAHPSLLVAHP